MKLFIAMRSLLLFAGSEWAIAPAYFSLKCDRIMAIAPAHNYL
ncbi:MAG TPA: hypothetical protein V6C84_14585 [Coleofasciculaceae cyanobacterium]